MKKAVLIFLLVLSATLQGQPKQTTDSTSFKITQKKCLKQKGIQLILKEVLADSRCPDDVTCVWAGQVKLVMSVYDGKKLVKDEILNISSMHKKETFKWF